MNNNTGNTKVIVPCRFSFCIAGAKFGERRRSIYVSLHTKSTRDDRCIKGGDRAARKICLQVVGKVLHPESCLFETVISMADDEDKCAYFFMHSRQAPQIGDQWQPSNQARYIGVLGKLA